MVGENNMLRDTLGWELTRFFKDNESNYSQTLSLLVYYNIQEKNLCDKAPEINIEKILGGTITLGSILEMGITRNFSRS